MKRNVFVGLIMFILCLSVIYDASALVRVNLNDCRTTDWGFRGRHDAERGISISLGDTLFRECGHRGYRIDRDAYRSGWNDGLHNYCRSYGRNKAEFYRRKRFCMNHHHEFPRDWN